MDPMESSYLAQEYGTPAFVFDEEAFRARMANVSEIFGENDLLLKEALAYAVRKGVRSYFELDPPKGDADVLRFAKEVTRLASSGADALVLSSAGSAALAKVNMMSEIGGRIRTRTANAIGGTAMHSSKSTAPAMMLMAQTRRPSSSVFTDVRNKTLR